MCIKNQKLDELIDNVIKYEFQTVNTSLEKRVTRMTSVNDNMGYDFPVLGMTGFQFLFLESRFSSMLLLSLFNRFNKDYENKVLNDVIERIKNEERLEVDTLTLDREMNDEKKRDEIIKRSSDKLISYANEIMNIFSSNVSKQPMVFTDILKTISKYMKSIYPNLSRKDRVMYFS